jgi:hypothetical protein
MAAITAEHGTPVAVRPAAAPASQRPVISSLRRAVGPVALVVGPVLGTVGMVLHPSGVDDDTALAASIVAHADQWMASHLLLAVGWAALAVGLASAARVARGRAAYVTLFGSIVGAAGADLMSFADITHGVVAYALAGQVSPARSVAIQTAYFQHPVVGVIMMGSMLLPVGVLALAVSALVSRVIPFWAGIVLLVGPLAIQAADAAGPGEILCGLPLVVGTTALARAAWRA